MKFSEFAQTYKLYIQAHLKPRTVEQYSGILRRILVPRFGERELTDIRRTHVVRLHLSLGDRRTAANRMLAVGSGLYRYANLLEEVPDGVNPFAKIKHFEESSRERFLNDSEYARIDQVLTTLEHEQTYSIYGIAAIRVLILTGARRSEIETLRWDSIDFAAGKIRLSDSKSGPRIIEMPVAVRKILLRLKPNGGEFVFPGRAGGRIWLYWVWKEVKRKTGLTDVRLHDLRHSYATRAVEVGISMPVIARLLGHTTIWTTSRYLHASERVVEKAATQVSGSISQIFD